MDPRIWRCVRSTWSVWLVMGVALLAPTLGAAQAPSADEAQEEERRRAAFARGPDALASMLAAKDSPLLRCDDVASQKPLLLEAAKKPAVLEAARSALSGGPKGVRVIAAALLASAGERGDEVQRELKRGASECKSEPGRAAFRQLLAPFPPTDPKQSLIIAGISEDENKRQLLEPMLEYRKGSWAPIVSEPAAGPPKWRVWLGAKWGRDFQAEEKPIPSGTRCYKPVWSYPGKGPKRGVAFSQAAEPYPFQSPPAAIAARVQRQRDAHPSLQLQQLRRAASAELEKTGAQCTPPEEWKLEKPKTTLQCTRELPGGQSVCKSTVKHILRGQPAEDTEPPESCVFQVSSLFWLRVSGSEVRILSTQQDLVDQQTLREEQGYLVTGEEWPSMLLLDGQPFLLNVSFDSEAFARVDVQRLTGEGLEPAAQEVLFFQCQ